MNTNHKSYTEIYQSLRPVAKRVAEILAYACCLVDYYNLYIMLRNTDSTITCSKYDRAINTLDEKLQALVYTKFIFNDRVFKLDPTFSLHILLELTKNHRNLENEFPEQKFWDKTNSYGKTTREAIIRYLQERILPDRIRLTEENECADELLLMTIHLVEFDGLEKILPPWKLAKEVCKGAYQRMEAIDRPQFIDRWFERFTKIDTNDSTYGEILQNTRALYTSLLPGRLDEILENTNQSIPMGYYMQAMYYLYQDDNWKAFSLFMDGIYSRSIKQGRSQPRFSILNYGYALNLLSDSEYLNNYKVKIINNQKGIFKYPCLPTRLLLAMNENNGTSSVNRILAEKPKPEPDTLTGLLMNTILRKYHMDRPQDTKRDKIILEKVADMGWKLVLLECYATMPDMKFRYEKLSRELGVTALITRRNWKTIPDESFI